MMTSDFTAIDTNQMPWEERFNEQVRRSYLVLKLYAHRHIRQLFAFRFALANLILVSHLVTLERNDATADEIIHASAESRKPITEPPCDYCSTQHRKSLIRDDDRVLAWLRAAHNGGAFPIRYFLSGPRVVNDTYGLFFYDPDGSYTAAYEKAYGYQLYGWRHGVMVVQGEDGTLWSALTGIAISGPQQGKRLKRIPSLVTDWGYWMMLHPESTTYDLFDGNKYQTELLPTQMSKEATSSISNV